MLGYRPLAVQDPTETARSEASPQPRLINAAMSNRGVTPPPVHNSSFLRHTHTIRGCNERPEKAVRPNHRFPAGAVVILGEFRGSIPLGCEIVS